MLLLKAKLDDILKSEEERLKKNGFECKHKQLTQETVNSLRLKQQDVSFICCSGFFFCCCFVFGFLFLVFLFCFVCFLFLVFISLLIFFSMLLDFFLYKVVVID